MSEKTDEKELCHYCANKAKYIDIAEIEKQRYAVIGVCQCHYIATNEVS
jgi:hypothetical protein